MTPFFDPRNVDEIYLAGQGAPPGLYCDTETGREVRLDQQGYLPASLDGRVAVYRGVEYTWAQHRARRADG